MRWRKPRRIFVNSMSDTFHDDVSNAWIDHIFATAAVCQQHTFILLTKRAQRMAEYMESEYEYRVVDILVDELSQRIGRWAAKDNFPLPNVWLGVSVENQQAADDRIPWLLNCPASVKWVSVEPMLGPVDLTYYMGLAKVGIPNGREWNELPTSDAFSIAPSGISWVIVGVESGPRARLCNIEWVRSLRDQCVSAGVPYFLKQLVVDGKMIHVPELDGRTWEEFPR